MFSPQSSNQGGGFTLIPENTIAPAILTVKAIKTSKAGSDYLDIMLTLADGEHVGRKVYSMLGNPWGYGADSGLDEAAKKMKALTIGQTTRLLESVGAVDPEAPESYAAWNEADLASLVEAIEGKEVTIRIGIKKGTGGYEDKNVIREYGSPSPQSNGHSLFQQVKAGVEVYERNWGIQHGEKPQASSAGSPAVKRPAAAPAKAASGPAWLKKG